MKYAKFFIAALGALITLAGQNDIVLPHIFSQIAPLLSAILVWAVPNSGSPSR